MDRKACWRFSFWVVVRMQRLLYGSLGKASEMRSSYFVLTLMIIG